MAICIEPELFQVGCELCDPFAAKVHPRLALESRIGFDKAVVDGTVVRVELHFDDGEGCVDRVQDSFKALLSSLKRDACEVLLRTIAKNLHKAEMFAGAAQERHYLARCPKPLLVLAHVPAFICGAAFLKRPAHFIFDLAECAIFRREEDSRA